MASPVAWDWEVPALSFPGENIRVATLAITAAVTRSFVHLILLTISYRWCFLNLTLNQWICNFGFLIWVPLVALPVERRLVLLSGKEISISAPEKRENKWQPYIHSWPPHWRLLHYLPTVDTPGWVWPHTKRPTYVKSFGLSRTGGTDFGDIYIYIYDMGDGVVIYIYIHVLLTWNYTSVNSFVWH